MSSNYKRITIPVEVGFDLDKVLAYGLSGEKLVAQTMDAIMNYWGNKNLGCSVGAKPSDYKLESFELPFEQ